MNPTNKKKSSIVKKKKVMYNKKKEKTRVDKFTGIESHKTEKKNSKPNGKSM